jgi:uncharacterized membrane protein YoaK (UPF0700 family)
LVAAALLDWRLRPISHPVKHLPDNHLRLAVALAALAGMIDVVAFLALGGFFASFMSGNSTRLAIGIGGNLSDAKLAASLILAFVGGVIGATLLGRSAGRQRTMRLLSLVAALVLLCAAIAKPYQATQLLLLAAAMGAMNCIFERDGEVSVGLTYMTGTLVRLGQGFARWLMREGGTEQWVRHAILWAGFLGGGLIGVGLYWRIGLNTLYVGGLFAAALALGLWWLNRPRPAPPEQQDEAEQHAEHG